MTNEADNAVLRWRVSELESDLVPLRPLPPIVSSHETRLEVLETRVMKTLDRLTTACIGAALTVAASSLLLYLGDVKI